MRNAQVFPRVALGLLLGLGLSAPAAAYTVYFGQDDSTGDDSIRIAHPNSDAARALFSNALPVTPNSFEAFATNTNAPIVLNFGVNSATLGGDGQVRTVAGPGTDGGGRFPIDGNNYWHMFVEPGQSATFSFSTAMSAFGFYLTDLGDEGGNVDLIFTRADTSTFTIALSDDYMANNGVSPTASVLFFGIVDNLEFVSMELQINAGNGNLGLDYLAVGTKEEVREVPEPATLGLLGLGLLGLGLSRRGRKGTAL
jgi:hypothetical protein